MKVTELMIGDWYYWEAEGKKYPMQVTKDTFKLSDEDISNFQPIPITEGFLTKNDFFCLGTSQQYHLRRSIHYAAYGKVTIKPTTISVDGNIVWNLEIASLSYGEGTILIQYVHELQHNFQTFGFKQKEIIV
jgi:hypothetical protein